MSEQDERTLIAQYSDELHSERANELLYNSNSVLDTANTGEHYPVSSGMHVSKLFQLQIAFQYRYICEYFSLLLWKKMRQFRMMDSVTALVGPERGAPPLMWMMANYFFSQSVRVITLQKVGREEDGVLAFELPQGTILSPDDVVLAVDDVFSTGGTLRGIIRACNRVSEKHYEGFGTNVMFAAFGVNRAPASWNPDKLAIPNAHVIREFTEFYNPLSCPLCEKGVPLRKI